MEGGDNLLLLLLLLLILTCTFLLFSHLDQYKNRKCPNRDREREMCKGGPIGGVASWPMGVASLL